MAVTAGALSKVSVGSTTAVLSSAAATAGTGPYTYQWYRSKTSGFTPGAGSLIAGATSLSLVDSGLDPTSQYFYKVIATDTGDSNATSTSAQLAIITSGASQNPNQFAQSEMLGQVALPYNTNTMAVTVAASQLTALVAGQGVKLVDNASPIPQVVAISADNDQVFGFINLNVKRNSWSAGDTVEVSSGDNVIWLQATGAIARGAQVTLDSSIVGGVAQATGSSADRIVGYALDEAVVAQLLRVKLKVPSFALDS